MSNVETSSSLSKSSTNSRENTKKESNYKVRQRLQQSERHQTKPENFQTELSLQGICCNTKTIVFLSDGKLEVRIKNGKTLYKIDLGPSVVVYFRKARRISIKTDNKVYKFKAKNDYLFDACMEHIRKHRLYRQDKIQHSKSKSVKFQDEQESQSLKLDENDESVTSSDEESSDSSSAKTNPVQAFKTTSIEKVPKSNPYQYRSRLPVPMNKHKTSLWAILKHNIGKDLSRISFPVEIFEPLSILQVLCEELEYSELLDKASKTDDKSLRLALVSTFAVSRYASTESRIIRKPFNPIEGETFENIRDDLGWWYFSEQVSHHPAISAVHAEGRGWEMSQSVSYDLKFWGKSIQAVPKSPVELVLHKYQEAYRWNKVKTSVNNLIGLGKRFIDHHGEMVIKCSNKLSCKLNFTENDHKVVGNGYDEDDSVIFTIDGKWSDSINVEIDGNIQCLWTKTALPSDSDTYYGFTKFAMTLNEIRPDVRPFLPPTDTRFRTDERFLEEGFIDEAKEQKALLEANQRSRRKLQKLSPKWFSVKNVRNVKMNSYRFNHRYWEARKTNFSDEEFDELWPNVA